MASATPKKTVLITGCSNASIGEALAREFLSRNYHVIGTARSVSKLSNIADLGAEVHELDVTSLASIESLQPHITHLDILFNNAGQVFIGPVTDTPTSTFRDLMDANFFGAVTLTKAMIPLLMESRGIIVNHTSQSPYGISSLAAAYAASKAALASYSDVLRVEMQPFGVRVVELVTGMASSNMVNNLHRHTLPEGSLYAPVKAEMDQAMAGEQVRGKEMKGDVYARKVVGDLLDGRRVPVWIWRGYLASTMWFVWIVKCLWKGILDGLMIKLMKLDLLEKRLKEKKLKGRKGE